MYATCGNGRRASGGLASNVACPGDRGDLPAGGMRSDHSRSQRSAPIDSGARRPPAHAAPATSAPRAPGANRPARTLTVSLVLRGDSAGVDAAIAALNDPTSPEYHHFLSPQEYASRFGADSATVASLAATLRAAGLRVPMATASAGLLDAQGTVGALDALFGVQLGDYCDKHGERYIAPDVTPHIPTSLAGVSGVLGLDTRSVIHTGSLPRRVGQWYRAAMASGRWNWNAPMTWDRYIRRG